jgi:hypothetical protein
VRAEGRFTLVRFLATTTSWRKTCVHATFILSVCACNLITPSSAGALAAHSYATREREREQRLAEVLAW